MNDRGYQSIVTVTRNIKHLIRIKPIREQAAASPLTTVRYTSPEAYVGFQFLSALELINTCSVYPLFIYYIYSCDSSYDVFVLFCWFLVCGLLHCGVYLESYLTQFYFYVFGEYDYNFDLFITYRLIKVIQLFIFQTDDNVQSHPGETVNSIDDWRLNSLVQFVEMICKVKMLHPPPHSTNNQTHTHTHIHTTHTHTHNTQTSECCNVFPTRLQTRTTCFTIKLHFGDK